MNIHVVQPGDSLYSISQEYKVPLAQLINDNHLPDPARLVVGQTIVILHPLKTYVVQSGDTLARIAAQENTTTRQLMRNNPTLLGRSDIYPGQQLIITYTDQKASPITVTGYAYPTMNASLLGSTLPYLTEIIPFTYAFSRDGHLIEVADEALIVSAKEMLVRSFMRLSAIPSQSLTRENLHAFLESQIAQSHLIDEIVTVMQAKGYRGIDVDFQSVAATDSDAFVHFITSLHDALSPLGYTTSVCLPPKSERSPSSYPGYDYQKLGNVADRVMLMTYTWGFADGPPIATAPINNVQRVIEYAVTKIQPNKILLGLPNYGNNWVVPHRLGQLATPISIQRGLALANQYYARIQYNDRYQAPWFRYVDEKGQEHEVWFEDARSMEVKLMLVAQYHLQGICYWNLIRPFPQNWRVLNAMYEITDGL